MEEDQSKKSEVSLPGAGGAEPTIIETLNKNTIINTTEEQKQNKSENKEEDQSNIHDSITSATTKEEEIKIDNNLNQSSSNIENIEKPKNILDIQSHLIETFDKNFSVSEDIDKSGVTIKEIPAKPEEFQTTSQIETETSPKSVIEIEPSIPKTHKPIQLDLDLSSNKRESKLINSFDEEEDNNKIGTENLNNNIKNNIIENDNIKVDTAKEVKIEISNKFIENEKDNIESSHIENNNNNILATKENLISDISSSKYQNLNEKLIESEKQQQNINENLNNIKENNNISFKLEEDPSEQITIPVAKNQENNFGLLSGKEDKLLIITDLSGGSNFLNTNNQLDIGINGLKNCTTPLEEEEKQKLLDSLPQLDSNIDPYKLAVEAKKEYYQSLRDYLDKYQEDKPPVPLQTYRWEDIRRAKEKGGYPWTHLYKRPLGPDEEPEIVLLLRKSQEFTFHKHQHHHHNQTNHQTSESPKSLKKVRIHDQVLVKETERYISDLSDTEELSSKASSPSSIGASIESEEDNKSALSESYASDSVSEGKKSKFSKLKGILKRKTGDKKKSQNNKPKESLEIKESTESKETATLSSASPSPSPLPSDIPDSSEILSDEYLTAGTTESDNQSEHSNKTKQEESSPKKGKCCHPIMDKIKNMADKQLKKRSIKKIPLKGDEKIVLEEQQKILKLRESPKADRSEIPKFVEKQDSEEIVEIVQLEESPSSKRKDGVEGASILVPDEIIEIPPQPSVTVEITQPDTPDSPPRKTLRKMKEHVYEEIDPNSDITMKIDEILELASVEALKKSLASQDESIMKDIEVNKKLTLDRMGSSEEEVEKSIHKGATLAPISSIDSTSSDEQEKRIALSTVAEESDAASIDDKSGKDSAGPITVIEEEKELELKPVLKKEPSPGPNGADKKVTFSHVEDESEPLREDIEVPEELKNVPNRWKDMA